MNVLSSLVVVLALILVVYLGVDKAGLTALFGTVLPYVAIVLFLGGFIYRILYWAKSPVPFRIPTTCGQQKTLPWIKPNNFDNPHNGFGVFVRMVLEVLFFRSLFRNTRTQIVKDGPKVGYASNYWLWFLAIAFHWAFLIVFVRHLRFFTEPIPEWILGLQAVDGFIEYGVPVFYITSVLLVVGVAGLLVRRLFSSQLRYISLLNDYFPLFLILGIALTGVLLRHYVKTDIVSVKEMTMGLISFSPVNPEGVHVMFYIHFFLVTCLFAYFPFSKLMHLGGVFLSPTRNLANNNREVRHINPWNPKVKLHSYAEYEDDFRDKMVAAGIPVDKE